MIRKAAKRYRERRFREAEARSVDAQFLDDLDQAFRLPTYEARDRPTVYNLEDREALNTFYGSGDMRQADAVDRALRNGGAPNGDRHYTENETARLVNAGPKPTRTEEQGTWRKLKRMTVGTIRGWLTARNK